MGGLAVALAIFGVLPPGFYFTFGFVSATIIGIIEYRTFMSRLKEEVYEKHNIEKDPSPLIYLLVVLLNIVFWGYGLTIHFLNALETAVSRTET